VTTRLRAFAALAASAVIATIANAQVKVGVVTSATGPTSFVGVPQKNSVALLPKRVGDTTIEYFYLDDASDSTQSVTNVKKLIAEQKIDALIGPVGLAQCDGRDRFHRRGEDADAGANRLARRGAADGREEALGVQDHAERRHHRRCADRAHDAGQA
jgi:branched-chain amino acid transport system substrate-binding protein